MWYLTHTKDAENGRLDIFINIQYFKNVISSWNRGSPQGSLLNEKMTSGDTEYSDLNSTARQFKSTWSGSQSKKLGS